MAVELAVQILQALHSGRGQAEIASMLGISETEVAAQLADPTRPDPPKSVSPSPLWYADDTQHTSNAWIYPVGSVVVPVTGHGVLAFGCVDIRDAGTSFSITTDEFGLFQTDAVNPPDWSAYVIGAAVDGVAGPTIFMPCSPGERTITLNILGNNKRFRHARFGILPL